MGLQEGLGFKEKLSTIQKIFTAIITVVVVFISSYFNLEPIVMALIAGLTAYAGGILSKHLIKEK
jgi:hypothetical protein